MVVRGKLNIDKLNYMYDTINRIVLNQNCYYDEEEIEELRKDKNNIFLKKQQHQGLDKI